MSDFFHFSYWNRTWFHIKLNLQNWIRNFSILDIFRKKIRKIENFIYAMKPKFSWILTSHSAKSHRICHGYRWVSMVWKTLSNAVPLFSIMYFVEAIFGHIQLIFDWIIFFWCCNAQSVWCYYSTMSGIKSSELRFKDFYRSEPSRRIPIIEGLRSVQNSNLSTFLF